MVIKYNKVRARETRLIPRSQGFGWVGFFVGMRKRAGKRSWDASKRARDAPKKGAKVAGKGAFLMI